MAHPEPESGHEQHLADGEDEAAGPERRRRDDRRGEHEHDGPNAEGHEEEPVAAPVPRFAPSRRPRTWTQVMKSAASQVNSHITPAGCVSI